ncbi:MAG TPA: hypothetical protein VH062_02215 [Polyangiaceae bacterium]|jgi:hypothetical protein|nr:hypothetical protein [Polyangiaceae bacterium]
MSDDFKVYPKARVAFGAGDLVQAVNVKTNIKNNAKLQHTLKRSPAGITKGPEEGEVSFDALVDEDGFERDYLKAVKALTIVQIRVKFPGETMTFTGAFTERPAEGSVDDAIKYSCHLIGKGEYV